MPSDLELNGPYPDKPAGDYLRWQAKRLRRLAVECEAEAQMEEENAAADRRAAADYRARAAEYEAAAIRAEGAIVQQGGGWVFVPAALTDPASRAALDEGLADLHAGRMSDVLIRASRIRPDS